MRALLAMGAACWIVCAALAATARAQGADEASRGQWERVPIVDSNGQWTSPTIGTPESPEIQGNAPTLTEAFHFSLHDDLRCWPRQIAGDFRSIFEPTPLWDIGFGGIMAAVSANNWDDHIRENTAKHARRWGGANNVLDVAGHPLTQLGGAATLYASSLMTQNDSLHEFSQTLFNALLVADLGATGLKYAFDTTRPNGESHGFPSGHTASAFAFAAVVEERYGGWRGFGAQTLACMVAWNRIDDRKHDLSDVIFGAAFGYAVGEAIACQHKLGDRKIQLRAHVDPENRSYGLIARRDY